MSLSSGRRRRFAPPLRFAFLGLALFLLGCPDGPTTPPTTNGIPTALSFDVQPGVTSSGAAIAPAVRVRIVDAGGNTVATATNSITIALTSGSGAQGAQLSGTLTAAASNGVATFSDLSIDKAASGYRFTATATGLTSATSTLFEIVPGAPAKLTFVTQPSNVAAAASMTPGVQVAISDAAGNTVTSATQTVTLSLSGGTAGAALTGTTSVAAVSGVARFDGLRVDKTGTGYTLVAASGSLTSATSASFNVNAGAAAKLEISTQPVSTTAGQSLTLTARVLDAGNNVVTTATNPITVALTPGTGTSGAVLSGTKTVSAVAGVATFTGLSIDKAGTGYTLTLTATGLSAATSSAFDVTIGAATALRFTAQPSSLAVGTAGSFTVTVVDAGGNTVTTATPTIALAITTGTGASGAVLGGTLSVAATAGVATFANITIDRAGTGYKLTASSTGLTSSSSTAFDVVAAPATQLAFTTAPTQMTVGQSGTFTVAIRDASGATVTSSTSSVTLAIVSGTGTSGAVLGGTLTVNAVNGVATFSNITIDRAGTGFQLRATSGTLTAATSASFDVIAAGAATLAWTTQPSAVTAGVAISPALQVTLRDATGAVATTSTAQVTLAIVSGTGTSGAVITGTATATPVNGIATFNNISIRTAGTGYQLQATATGFANATSSAFDVTPAAASAIVWTTQPTSLTSGQAATFTARIVDAFNNTVTSATNSVTVALGAGTGTAGAVLGGTKTVTAVAGIATFSTLTVNKAGTGYQLVASASGLTSATTTAFSVVAGAAAKLAFSVQPVNANVGSAISPAVQLTVQDAAGNTVTTSTASVTVAIASGTGASGAILGGTTTRAAVSGVATFDNLTIDRAGTAFALAATASGLTAAQSSTFDVVASPTLSFTTQPTSTTAGAAIAPAIQVTLRDATGNIATSATTQVTLTLATGTGTSGATLLGTLTATPVNGVATFSNVSLDLVGTGYQLVATAASFTSATSTAFSITAGAPASLGVSTYPTTMTSGQSATIQVVVRDAHGNTVTTATNSITLAIQAGSGTAGAALGGTTTVAAVAGTASFTTITLDKVGANYQLVATSAGLASANTGNISVVAGAAANLRFTTHPSSATSMTAIAPAIVVSVEDAAGNPVTTGSHSVTLTIADGTGAAGAALGGTVTTSTVNGAATFSSVSIDKAGIGYRLVASASSLTSATSNTFDVAAGAAATLDFLTVPATVSSGAAATFEVRVLDAGGNVVTTSTAPVTLALASGTAPVGATLGGTTTVSAVSGVATFSTLLFDIAADGYRLDASSAGLTGVQSAAFNVVAGAPAQLLFSGQPSSVHTNTTIPSVAVSVYDAAGNFVSDATTSVTIAITTGSGAAGAVLAGTKTVNAVNGIAQFSDLAIDLAASGYTLTATATGLSGVASTSFNIGVGISIGVARLVITPNGGSVAVGNTITLAAKIVNADGSETPVTATWATSNPGKATVDGSGVVTGVATGTVTITATKSGLAAHVTITITP